ncbi:MAG: alkaline phosphatase D family protein [Myxococcales bacterium]
MPARLIAAVALLSLPACATTQAGTGTVTDSESASASGTEADTDSDSGSDSFRLAFGSCHESGDAPGLWDQIVSSKPDVWAWLGDNIYADTEDMDEMAALYAELRRMPGYAALRERGVRIVGTWDDHDFGHNDAGKEYPMRAQAQQQLLDFLGEPPDSPRRHQQGVYASYDFGQGDRRVRLILLDTRYHRDPPGQDADVLGAAQWQWLHDQLHGSPAAVNIIASSVQLVPDEHRFEKWANFPRARERLLSLIAESGARNVLVISGDRHFAELSVLRDPPLSEPLYELTSSSLSRPWDHPPDEPNCHRLQDTYWHVNFGLLEIDWTAHPPTITLQILGADGKPHIEKTLPLR